MFAWRNTLEKMSELNLWFNFCSKIKLEWGRGNVQLIWIWLTIKETCLLCIWSQNQIFNARLEHGSAFLPSRTRNGGTVEPEVSSNRLHGSVPRSLSTLHSVIDLSSLVSSIRFGSRETRPASASARQLTPFILVWDSFFGARFSRNEKENKKKNRLDYTARAINFDQGHREVHLNEPGLVPLIVSSYNDAVFVARLGDGHESLTFTPKEHLGSTITHRLIKPSPPWTVESGSRPVKRPGGGPLWLNQSDARLPCFD